jgi:hypothetical protein
VLYWIATNITDAGGTLTEAEFLGRVLAAFRYGNQDDEDAVRVAAAGRRAATASRAGS